MLRWLGVLGASMRLTSVKGSGAVAIQVPVTPAGTGASFLLYAGPKKLEALQAYGRAFETAIDYGAVANAFAFFAQILLRVMRWFHGFVANWGVAIILLTLTVKVLLYPLTLKSMKSMAGMRKLQPEIEKLKAKFGDDKEGFARAQMALFQEHKVSMTGGCLPMLVQIPVFFSLYKVLYVTIDMRHAPFFGWIVDLSAKDPYYVFPVLMGGSMFLQQYMTPAVGDPAQRKMMLVLMPAMMTFFFAQSPAGLTIYYFVFNLVGILQTWWVMRTYQPQPIKV